MHLETILNESPIEQIVVNALGSHYFDCQDVCQVLHNEIEERRKNGGQTGSIDALLNILPALTEAAKEQY